MVGGGSCVIFISSFCMWSSRAACLRSQKSVRWELRTEFLCPALTRRITLLERFVMIHNAAVNGILFPIGLLVNLISESRGHELHSSWGRNTKINSFLSVVLICRCFLVIPYLSSKKRLTSLLTSVS